MKIIFADHALETINAVHIVLMEQEWLQMAHASSVIRTARHVQLAILFAPYAILEMGWQQYTPVSCALILIVPNVLLITQFVRNVEMVLALIQQCALNVISIV